MNQKYQITVHMPTENDHTFQRETKWVTHSESPFVQNESCKIGRICKKTRRIYRIAFSKKRKIMDGPLQWTKFEQNLN